MSVRSRVQHLMKRAKQRGVEHADACPVCRGHQKIVMLNGRNLPDGTSVLLEEPPKPCEGCGKGPPWTIQIMSPLEENEVLPEEQAMLVELRDITTIKPYENNPRLNDDAVDAVAPSIHEFGFRQPIVVDDDGVIIVGHTRWKAAQKLGLEKVPVHVATDLTPDADQGLPHRRQPDGDARRLGLRPAAARAGRAAGHATSTWACSASTPDELAELLGAGLQEGLTRSRRRSRAAGRGDHAAGRPVDPRRPPPALRRQQQARGRGPAARRRHDPPGQHRPAVQREGRAALQQRHRRRPQLVHRRTHHQSLDLARHPEQVEADRQEAAGQGPAAGQRLRVRRGVRPAARTPGSATSPACCSPAARSTSGAATPTAATTRRS